MPLDDIAADLKLEESDFIPAVWKGGIYQDKRYGIPLDVHSLAQYWNSDQLIEGGPAGTAGDTRRSSSRRPRS